MRQHAWLHATPERAKGEKLDAPRLSRLEQLRRDRPEYEPEMPPVSAEHIVLYLFEVGPTLTTGGYSSSLTFQEIESWQKASGLELQPWETRFLVSLSRDFVAESFRAEKRDAKEPMREELGVAGVEQLIVAKNLQRMVEEMAKL